jgi:GNAT superfamily N-acetyltransferase
MNISIHQIEPFSDPETVRGIVAAYQRTFGGEPWNEGYVCPVCGDSFPLTQAGGPCLSCSARGTSVLLDEYWPASKVTSDFNREMGKPEALCLVAKDEDAIVGFIWGYRIVIGDHVDDYLESPGLSQLVSGPFFYLDDAAVIPEYQCQGIGKKLVAQMLRIQPEKNILARTLDGCRMFRILTDFRGETVLHITRNRVIMVISL